MRVPHEALRDTIAVENWTSAGSMGEGFAASRNVRASVQPSSRLLVGASGADVSAVYNVIIRPEAGPVPIGSRVTYAGQQFRVIQAAPYPDSRRPSHYELAIADWS